MAAEQDVPGPPSKRTSAAVAVVGATAAVATAVEKLSATPTHSYRIVEVHLLLAVTVLAIL